MKQEQRRSPYQRIQFSIFEILGYIKLYTVILVNALAVVFSVWSHLAHLGHTLFVISNVISQYLYQRLMYLVTQITLF
jgi:hypothetical protein